MPGQKAPTQEYESERERQMENIFTDFNFPTLGPSQKPLGTSCLEQANALNL